MGPSWWHRFCEELASECTGCVGESLAGLMRWHKLACWSWSRNVGTLRFLISRASLANHPCAVQACNATVHYARLVATSSAVGILAARISLPAMRGGTPVLSRDQERIMLDTPTNSVRKRIAYGTLPLKAGNSTLFPCNEACSKSILCIEIGPQARAAARKRLDTDAVFLIGKRRCILAAPTPGPPSSNKR